MWMRGFSGVHDQLPEESHHRSKNPSSVIGRQVLGVSTNPNCPWLNQKGPKWTDVFSPNEHDEEPQ